MTIAQSTAFNNPFLNATLPYMSEFQKMQYAMLPAIQPKFFMPVSQGFNIFGGFGNNFNLFSGANLFNFNTPFNNSGKSVRLSGNLGKDIVSTAGKYLGYNEKDGSYKLFTKGKSQAWCADFATYAVKEAYRANGKTLPAGFGSSSVSGLMSWGKQNGCYLNTSGAANKAKTIAANVKPGDIIIFKNGKSHTGIVKSVAADGTVTTIEGNTSNKVGERTYAANNRTISGFVQIA